MGVHTQKSLEELSFLDALLDLLLDSHVFLELDLFALLLSILPHLYLLDDSFLLAPPASLVWLRGSCDYSCR